VLGGVVDGVAIGETEAGVSKEPFESALARRGGPASPARCSAISFDVRMALYKAGTKRRFVWIGIPSENARYTRPLRVWRESKVP
jgi:hypothetical protein